MTVLFKSYYGKHKGDSISRFPVLAINYRLSHGKVKQLHFCLLGFRVAFFW